MQEKKAWNKPQLTVHGSVEEITAGKVVGFSDFFIVPIDWADNGGSTGS